jgi:hypothetical protein
MSDQGQGNHGGRRGAGFGHRDGLPARYRHARRDGSEGKQERLIKTHMALVAMCAENSHGIVRALVKDLGLRNSNQDGLLQAIEIRENDAHLVRAVVGVTPTIANRRIEKVCHQTVRVTCHGRPFFKHARSLKLGETFQLIAGKSLQKIRDQMPIDRNCRLKKGTDQKRARGDSGQI